MNGIKIGFFLHKGYQLINIFVIVVTIFIDLPNKADNNPTF